MGLLIAGVMAYPFVFMAKRLLPLSDFPKVPLIFHEPELKTAVVSLEGADDGKPVSKFSVIFA